MVVVAVADKGMDWGGISSSSFFPFFFVDYKKVELPKIMK